MLIIHLLHNYPPLLPSINSNLKKSILVVDNKVVFCRFKKSSSSSRRRRNYAAEKESEFETDQDKAREALRKLDEQLQSLSTKKLSSPKIRAVDLRPSSFQGEEEEVLEISGSFWAYAASFLLIFTLFYNIIFVTVIKPSIDGPEPVESNEIIIKLLDDE